MVCLVVLCAVLWNSSKSKPVTVGLVFIHEDLDLGHIKETQTVESIVRLKNTSSGTLKLIHFGTSCDCLEVTPKEAEFQAGETKSFRLLIKGDVDADAVMDDQGVTTKTIQLGCHVQTAADQPPQLVSQNMTVKISSCVKIDPAKYEIDAVSTRNSQLTALVSVRMFDPVVSFRVNTHDEWKCDVRQVNESESKLLLTCLHPQRTRLIRDTISLIPVTRSGQEMPIKRLSLTGSLEEEIHTQHKLYHAGRIKQQEPVREVVMLTSLSGVTFNAVPKTVPSGVHVERLKDSTFQIDYTGTHSGEQQISIVFAIEYSGNEIGEKVVQLQYYGE